MITYTLAEVRDGTGWPDGVRFRLDSASHHKPAFPADGLCLACGGELRYSEQVPSVRSITINDDDGVVMVSGYSEEITEAATAHTFECADCLALHADPTEWDWS